LTWYGGIKDEGLHGIEDGERERGGRE